MLSAPLPQVIREHFKSKLPIEVYYYGEAEADTTILHAMEVRQNSVYTDITKSYTL